MMCGEPTDADGKINGTFYKIGRFDRVYRWIDWEWILSTITPNAIDIKVKIEKRRAIALKKANEKRNERHHAQQAKKGSRT
jgi:hypothetical protein